uniref:Uncharacterized protein n=1 Tax=Amazona collaria TaxID=241587 RepID=A0A8B9FXN6_9PSIT
SHQCALAAKTANTLFCSFSRNLGRPVTTSTLIRLQMQILSHPEVRLSIPSSSIDTAAKFTGVAPAGWPLRAVVSEQGLAAHSFTMNNNARNMLFQSSKQQSFSCITYLASLRSNSQ